MNDAWPSVERALIAFSGEFYLPPTIIWYTIGGYIHQDVADGCVDINEFLDWPDRGLWVWEGQFKSGYYDGIWREPTDDEWIMILQQKNPWS